LTAQFWWKERIFKDFGHAYKVELVYEKKGLQKIQIFKNETWGYFFVLDGIVQFTEKDEYIYHETITYLPASLLPSFPESVLIIGGGDGGVLKLVQSIPSVKKIVQYEVDEQVFELCQKYFPGLSGDFSDERLEFKIKDGLEGIKERESQEFDLVIVDCTDPVGPAKTLYTLEFYEEAERVLKPHGVFIQQASLPVYFPWIIKESYPLLKRAFEFTRVARAFVPCYGEEIAFFVASKEQKNWEKAILEFKGDYYHPGLNSYYFTLPLNWLRLISSDEDA